AQSQTAKPDALKEQKIAFKTTADSLVSEAGNATEAIPRTAEVKYEIHRSLDGFEIDRVEFGAALPVLHTQAEPKLEFFNGKKWLPEWTAPNSRPVAIRINIEDERYTFAI